MNKNSQMKILLYEEDIDCVNKFTELVQQSQTKFFIQAHFTDTAKVLNHITKYLPDILLLNVGMHTPKKLRAIKKVKSNSPYLPILAYSSFYSQELLFNCINYGATGFIIKDCKASEVIKALKDVIKIDHINKNSVIPKQAIGSASQKVKLSNRQKQVLQELKKGNSYKSIALNLGISKHTVNAHLQKIYSILKVKSAAEAVAVYLEQKNEDLAKNSVQKTYPLKSLDIK